MVVITGANGFIGQNAIDYFVKRNYNVVGLDIEDEPIYSKDITGVVHLGAISNTLEKDWGRLTRLNVDSTNKWFDYCNENNIPFIFASSAAIYGNGNGPLNLYAKSKLDSEEHINNRAVVLRFFNVYGPHEEHKGRMASTIYHWYNQINDTGKAKIFEGSDSIYRDFIYVQYLIKVIEYFLNNYIPGTYDLGSGTQNNFEYVLQCLLEKIGFGEKEYIKFPEDIVNQYQKNTSSDMTTLEKIGYNLSSMTTIKEGVSNYVDYLKQG